MKKIHLIPVFLLGLSFSCKDSSQTISPSILPVEVIDYDAQMQDEVKNHPSINAPVVEQNRVKNIDVYMYRGLSAIVKYDYYTDGKIKSVGFSNDNPKEYLYKGDILTDNYAKKSYLLDNNGLAITLKDDDKVKFFYKDGFLLRTNVPNDLRFTYSTTGNLIKVIKGDESLNYFYTDYTNTIRQEVLKIQEYSNSIRDSFLGHYSTNLIKEISYKGANVMTFEYEFDAQKRVKKITMNRLGYAGPINVKDKFLIGPPDVIVYNLSY